MDYPKSTPGIGLVDGRFVDENPSAGTPGSLIPAAWANALMTELLGLITAAGMAPDEADTAQLVKAVRLLQLGAVGGYALDTGAANVYVATYAPAVSELKDGMVLRFKPKTSNTGASTFAPNGLAPRPILTLKGLQVGAGDIAEGAVVWLQYDSSLDSWISILSMAQTAASEDAAGVVELATQDETRALADGLRVVTPLSLEKLVIHTAPVAGSAANLKLSASGASSLVTVSADGLVLTTDTGGPVVLAPALTINAATVGAGGLDKGVIAASTWYSVWVAWNGATAVGLLSLSATAPTLPAGYTYRARVGWIRTDGTANKYPLGFFQVGNSVQYKYSNVIATGVAGSVSAPTWVPVSVANVVPPTAGRAFIGLTTGAGANNTGAMANPNSGAGAITSNANPPMISVSCAAATPVWVNSTVAMLLESMNVYWASGLAAAAMYCFGWEDNL